MAAIALSHYNLRADRDMMAQLRDFYCEYVGLRLGARPPLNTFGYWLYAGDEAVLHLSEIRPGEERQSAQKTAFDHVAFVCENMNGMLARLQAGGIAFRLSDVPAMATLPRQRQIFFNDPAGNGIELNFSFPEK
ncbi:MAG: VOC family protein [Burkholderiales bacterium]|nr:VOC family protein [Burkholderiales bacterium]